MRGESNSMIINGKVVPWSVNNVVIQNGQVIVDGNIIQTNMENNAKVTINGDVKSIQCSGSVEVHGNSGKIDCGGSCTVDGDVSGSVDAGGSVSCGNVGGDIDAGGSVRCR